MGPKDFWVWKNLWLNNVLGRSKSNFSLEKFWSRKTLSIKAFKSEKSLGQKLFFCNWRAGLMSGGEGSRVNVRRGVAWVWFGLVRLFAKFKTSRMFPSGIFWCGSSCCCSCSCCDRGKTKSTPCPKTEVWTLDWSLTKWFSSGHDMLS